MTSKSSGCWWDACTVGVDAGLEQVAAFLARLAEFPELKSTTIQEFEVWLFRNRTVQLCENTKFFLIVGNNNNGLIFEIGCVEGNILSGMAALRLLRKLLQHEYCSEADQYLAIFSQLDVDSYIRAMALEKYFSFNFCNARIDACQVLEALSHAITKLDINSVLSGDVNSVQEYKNWKHMRQAIGVSRYLFPASRANLPPPSPPLTPSKGKRHSILQQDMKVSTEINEYQLHTLSRPQVFEKQMQTNNVPWRKSNQQTKWTYDDKTMNEFVDSDSSVYDWEKESFQTHQEPESHANSCLYSDEDYIQDNHDKRTPCPNSQIHLYRNHNSHQWNYLKIPAVFCDFGLRIRYCSYFETIEKRLSHTPLTCESFPCPPIEYITEDTPPLLFPTDSTKSNKDEYKEENSSQNSTLRTQFKPSKIKEKTLNRHIQTSFSSNENIIGVDYKRDVQFVLQLQLTLPFPAYVVAAILFDHRAVITDVLTTSWATRNLSDAQWKDLESLKQTHWFSKTCMFEDQLCSGCLLCRVSSCVIEASCPPRKFMNVQLNRTLRAYYNHTGNTTRNDTEHSFAILETGRHPSHIQSIPFSSDSRQKCFPETFTVTGLKGKQTLNHYTFPTTYTEVQSGDDFTPVVIQDHSFISKHLNCYRESSQKNLIINSGELKQCRNQYLSRNNGGHLYECRCGTAQIEKMIQCSNNEDWTSNVRKPLHIPEMIVNGSPQPYFKYDVIYSNSFSCTLNLTARFDSSIGCMLSSELLGESPELFKSIWNVIYVAKIVTPYYLYNPPPSSVSFAIDKLGHVTKV